MWIVVVTTLCLDGGKVHVEWFGGRKGRIATGLTSISQGGRKDPRHVSNPRPALDF